MLARVPAHEAMITDFRSLPATARMADAAEDLIRTNQTELPVVDSTGVLIGLLDRDGIVKALAEGGGDTPVTSAMRTSIPVVTEWHRLDDGLELFQGGARAIAVTDASGQLTGLITLENLAEQLMIVRASEKRTVRLPRKARLIKNDPTAQN
jgi:CBS domain-containing protein